MTGKSAHEFDSKWQQILDDLTEKGRSTGAVLKVKVAKTLTEKVKLCYDDSVVRGRLKTWIQEIADRNIFSKSQDISNQYRTKGNKIYAGPKPERALDMYTRAIFYAPKDSEEYFLSFGNRSAVLQFMGKHKECVEDVITALSGTQNDVGRHARLLIRKVKSLILLKDADEATKCLNLVASLFPSNREDLHKEHSKLITEMKETLKRIPLVVDDAREEAVSPEVAFHHETCSFKPNIDLPGASEAVTVKKSLLKGRHVVARRDIEVGEVVFLEKPFAFVCLPDKAHLHCQFCCRKTFNPHSCDLCAEGSYCSAECKQMAWKQFHQWECGPGLELCYNIGIAHLGLRVSLVGLTAENDRYGAVKGLLEHIDKMHPDDLYQYTLISTALVIYLKNFTDLFSTLWRQSHMDFGATILLHVAQLVANGHALYDCQKRDEETPFGVCSEEQVRMGTGIYPAASMMNHSCDPSIIPSFHNQFLVVKAIKFIPRGAEVFNCYGPHFRRTPTKERQELLLGQYFFKCGCDPCSAPKDFLDKFRGSWCQNCEGVIPYNTLQCVKCRENISLTFQQDIDRADVLMKRAKDYVKLKEPERAIEPAEEALKQLTKHLYVNNREVLECKDLIARSYASKGEFKKSARLIEENLNGARELYGGTSIEVAGEIFKLASVVACMMKTKNPDRDLCERTKIYAAEAEVIYKLFLGIYHPKYNSLKKNLQVLHTLAGR